MLLSLPPGTGTEQLIFSEGEGDCTSEMRRGQFSIFGAIEEKRGRRFSRIFCGSRELFEHPCDASVRAFLLVRSWRRESVDAEGRVVHRVCTGNAETVLSSQFSVLSSQFSVLSSQFSVLSSQFSVLSSQFSVLSSQFSVRMPRTFQVFAGDCGSFITFAPPLRLQELPERKLGAPGREFLSARQISLRGGVHDHRSGMWHQSGREQSCGADGIQREDVQLLLGGLQKKIRPESGAVRAASCVKIRLQKKGPCFSQGPHLFWPVRKHDERYTQVA